MKFDLLGIKIDALAKAQVLQSIKTLLSKNERVFIVTPYSESIVRAQRDEEFKKVLNSADIALPDGIGILWAANYLAKQGSLRAQRSNPQGIATAFGLAMTSFTVFILSSLYIIFKPDSIHDPIPEKISGSEFVWDLANLADKHKYSIFLLGGFGDTSELAANKLQSRFPKLKIAGTNSDFSFSLSAKSEASQLLSPDEERGAHVLMGREVLGEGRGEATDVIDQINSSGADFLFAAIGPVRQEKWLHKNRHKLAPKLLIGLGGTFDYLAGIKPLAPQIWRRAGLEWLWRLITQPKRVLRITKGVFGLIYYVLRSKSNVQSKL